MCIRSGIYSDKVSPYVEDSESTSNPTSEKRDSNDPRSSKVDSLIQKCSDPDVLKIPEFESIIEQFAKNSSHTLVQGAEGAGKTSLLAQMESRWQETHKGIVRKVSCERPIARTSEDSYSILSDLIGIDFRQDSKDTGVVLATLSLIHFQSLHFQSAVENIGDPRGQPGNKEKLKHRSKDGFELP